jgi:hypothetical protein
MNPNATTTPPTLIAAPWSSLPAFPAARSRSSPSRLRGQRARKALEQRRWVGRFGRFPLIAATYLSKFSVPPFGAMGLALVTPLLLLVAVGGFVSGLMVLHLRRALAFALMIGTLLLLQVFAADGFSLGSMALLIVAHLPYVFQQRRSERPRDEILRYFQQLAMVIAVLGIAQYCLQFLLGPALSFPIENLVPGDLTVAKYNKEAILHYGSEVRRANGVFMIEPSLFSQLMAIGLVTELVTRKRLACMAVLATAMLVSYSGTGLMLLAVCLVFEGVAQRRWAILAASAVLGVLIVALGIVADVPMITNLVHRSSEFGSANSSGAQRFVGGFTLFEEMLWPEPLRAFFGYGAGSLVGYAAKSPTRLAEMFLFKAVFEYGLVGAGAYFGFLGYCIFTAAAPRVLRVAVCVAIMIGGMFTPFGHILACGLLLWPRPLQQQGGEARGLGDG